VSANFVSTAAAAGDFRRQVRSRRRALAVTGTRRVGKRHMLYNQTNPRIEIDPRTIEIRIDGAPLPPLPDEDLPLNRRYFLL
jgi:urease subunit alpha